MGAAHNRRSCLDRETVLNKFRFDQETRETQGLVVKSKKRALEEEEEPSIPRPPPLIPTGSVSIQNQEPVICLPKDYFEEPPRLWLDMVRYMPPPYAYEVPEFYSYQPDWGPAIEENDKAYNMELDEEDLMDERDSNVDELAEEKLWKDERAGTRKRRKLHSSWNPERMRLADPGGRIKSRVYVESDSDE